VNWIFVVPAAACVACIVLFLSFRLSGRSGRTPGPDLFDEVSTSKYLPMERLLDESEFRFLAAQRGFTPEIGRQFRNDRRRLFRGYLRLLRKDFDRLYEAAKVGMIYCSEDRSELAKVLLAKQLAFRWTLLRIEAGLLLSWTGFGPMPVEDLIRSLDVMQAHVRALLATPFPLEL
jgi:hypothetical protein